MGADPCLDQSRHLYGGRHAQSPPQRRRINRHLATHQDHDHLWYLAQWPRHLDLSQASGMMLRAMF